MRSRLGTVGRWALRSLVALALMAGFYFGIIFYPSPLFAYAERIGGYDVFADEPIPGDMEQVVADIERRVSAMEHGPPGKTHRIYLCSSPRLYAAFAFLTRKSAESLAIGLSVANETFVNLARVRRFSEVNHGVLRHTRFEGNLAEVVAHELAHFNSLRALGLRRHLALPLWKSEGWAEYQANVAAIRADPAYDLHERIDRLRDAGYWATGAGLARRMWEAQLLAEFLGEIEGYGLADLAREDVTEAFAREAMMEWHR